MKSVSILAFSGSTRQDSYNQRLVNLAAQQADPSLARITVINLRDYPLPLFDQDFETEQGIPAHAESLKAIIHDHDGLLIACPEYNGSLTAVLKNMIDWVSRRSNEKETLCFKGKVVSLMSASPGALGGLRGLVHVRAILSGLGCVVLPDQLAVSAAHKAFDGDGQLLDPISQTRLKEIVVETLAIASKLSFRM